MYAWSTYVVQRLLQSTLNHMWQWEVGRPLREGETWLLLKLSKSPSLCENIGYVNGTILILVGMISNKSKEDATLQIRTLCRLKWIEFSWRWQYYKDIEIHARVVIRQTMEDIQETLEMTNLRYFVYVR